MFLIVSWECRDWGTRAKERGREGLRGAEGQLRCQLVSDPRRQGRLWTEGAVGLRLSRFGEGGPGPRTGDHDIDRIRVNSGQSISITTQPHVSVNSSRFSRQRNEMLVRYQPVAQPISPSFLKVTQQCRCKSGAPLIGRHGGDTEVKANKV